MERMYRKFSSFFIFLFCMVVSASSQSYYEKYGPGSSSHSSYSHSSSKVLNKPSGGGSHHTYEYTEHRYHSTNPKTNTGENYYEPINTVNRKPSTYSRQGSINRQNSNTGSRACPNNLDSWENEMSYCMSPILRLQGRKASAQQKCSAYVESRPCVKSLLGCKIDNPRIPYYKSNGLKQWDKYYREAEVYGTCANML